MIGAVNYPRLFARISKQNNFRIRLSQYDGGDQIFWPCYKFNKGMLIEGTVVLFTWYYNVCIGVITETQKTYNKIRYGVKLINKMSQLDNTHMLFVREEDITAILMAE